MSLRADNTYHCDRCGTDVGNGGIDEAAFLTHLEPDTGAIVRLHLCPKCTGIVLARQSFPNFHKERPNVR